MTARTFEQVEDIIKKYYILLKSEGYPIEKIILFGSYAKNNQNIDSDIDLAIVLKEFIGDKFNTRLKLMKYARDFDDVIEPHLFLLSDFVESDPFIDEIIRTGKKII